MQWFYVENNEQAGPVEDAEFARLQVQGLILDPTLVYCQGMADWMTLADARSQGFWTPPTTSAAAPPADAVPASSNPLAAAGFKPKMAESGGDDRLSGLRGAGMGERTDSDGGPLCLRALSRCDFAENP